MGVIRADGLPFLAFSETVLRFLVLKMTVLRFLSNGLQIFSTNMEALELCFRFLGHKDGNEGVVCSKEQR